MGLREARDEVRPLNSFDSPSALEDAFALLAAFSSFAEVFS